MTDGLKGLSSLFLEISSTKIYYLLIVIICNDSFLYFFTPVCILISYINME